ncbi:MAG: RNA polymerase sigma factor, partial [Chloroflexota bacterium]
MTRAAAALEPADIEAILREGQLPVLRYVLSRAASPAEAHDLAQETLVRAYRALAQGHRPRQPVPWLLAIARNVLLETWRSHRYERRLKERLAYVMGPEWQSPWQERVERRVVVGDAVDALPPELREPVVLHYFGGLPVAAVAGHLDITPGAVKMRLLRARQTLRGALEDLMNETTRPTTISIPDDLAARAKLLAEKPPLYDSISVAVQVGGRRWPTSPMSPPALSGEMPSLDDLRLAVERLHAVRLAGDRPLTDRLTLWPALDPFEH